MLAAVDRMQSRMGRPASFGEDSKPQPPMNRSDFRFRERLRVRWAEIDAQQIVFNGHYLMYLDTAVAGYWRALALPYHATMHDLGGDLYVRKSTLEYLGSARYDEQLDVGLRCARIGTSSLTFDGAVFRGEKLLVRGELVYVFADPTSQTSRAVPSALREVLHGFEAGASMIDVRVASWADLADAARAIRTAVFVDEQGIPADLACDDADPGALHAVAYNRLGRPVASGRLLPADVEGTARVGRMASLAQVRGSGIGAAVLDALTGAARSRGDRAIELHAMATAMPFYARAGYTPLGEPFVEAGLPHRTMRRVLEPRRSVQVGSSTTLASGHEPGLDCAIGGNP